MSFYCGSSISNLNSWLNAYCSSACSAGPDKPQCIASCVSSLSSPCYDYTLPAPCLTCPTCPSIPTCPTVPSDTVFINVDSCSSLSHSAVDSLNTFFIDGLAGGVSFAFPMLASLFFILLVTWLFTSILKNS